MLSDQARKGEGRENVKSVLLGRGASDDKVDHWLREAAPVEGFIGFAIGRSIWWDALKGFLDESLTRDEASEQIAENYLRFIKVYDEAATSVTRLGRVGISACRDARSRRAIPDSIAAAATASATAGATARLKTLGMMYSGPRSDSGITPAIARAAASFIASSMPRARTSSAPRKMPGNASTLLIWFG